MVRLTQSFCCARCFKHRALKRYIGNHGTPNRVCDYCAATRVHVVEIGELTNAFQNFMDLFDKDEYSLDTLIFYADEWGIFNGTRHDDVTAVQLFNDIINAAWDDDDGEPPVDAASYYRYRRAVSDDWDAFCEEVRSDPTTPFPLDEYLQEELGRRLVIVPVGSTLFRARLGCVDEDGVLVAYRGADISAPPTTTSSGRPTGHQSAFCTSRMRRPRALQKSGQRGE